MPSSESKTFTCVSCPMGCLLNVSLSEDGDVTSVAGNGCARGVSYAQQEAVYPRRNVSVVVMAAGSLEPLSVRTAEPIPKDRISAAVSQMRAMDVHAPIEAGQALVDDVAGTGVAVVATKSIGL